MWLKNEGIVAVPHAAAGQWSVALAGLGADDARWEAGSSAWVVSFATVQNDKYLEATDRLLEVCPGADTEQDRQRSLRQWDPAARALALRLRRLSAHKASKDRPLETSLIASVRPDVEQRVSERAGKLVSAGESEWTRASEVYAPMMEFVARAYAPGATVAQTRLRRSVGRLRPDLGGAAPEIAGEEAEREGGDN